MGFIGCESNKNNLPAIATGNWGCGAFRGNPKLKVLLQLMAAAVAGRSVVYFTFGDTSLRDNVAEMYSHFVKHETNIGIEMRIISERLELIVLFPFQRTFSPCYYNIKSSRPRTRIFTVSCVTAAR